MALIEIVSTKTASRKKKKPGRNGMGDGTIAVWQMKLACGHTKEASMVKGKDPPKRTCCPQGCGG
jgi:hypothetical protein